MTKIYKKFFIKSPVAFFIVATFFISSCKNMPDSTNINHLQEKSIHKKECPAKKMDEMTKDFLSGKDITKDQFAEVVSADIKGYFNGDLAYNGIDEFYTHLSKMRDYLKSVKITMKDYVKNKNKVFVLLEIKGENKKGKEKTMYAGNIMTISDNKVSHIEGAVGISRKDWKKLCNCDENKKEQDEKNNNK